MTNEELDALEALAAAATQPSDVVVQWNPFTHRAEVVVSREGYDFVNKAREAVPALIAALREARAALESKTKQNLAMMRVIAQHQEETDALRGEIRATHDALANRIAKGNAAFACGVAAMREAAAQACRPILRSMVDRGDIAATIRALPDPEDR